MCDTLAVICMVKNEEERIKETLKQFIDSGITNILVNDTGSTDKTTEKIIELSSDIKRGYSIFENFSKSRNLTLDMAHEAFENVTFFLMIDCEWYVENLDSLIKFCDENRETSEDVFYTEILFDEGILDKLPRLFRRGGNYRYRNDIHEEVVSEKMSITIPNFRFRMIQTAYGKTKTKNRNREFDIPYYLSKGDNITAFEMFYLAQAYHNIEDYDNALLWYGKIIIEKQEYLYICHYRMGEIYSKVNSQFNAFDSYSKALLLDEKRVEPYVRMSQIFDNKLKYQWAKQACSITIDQNSNLNFFDTSLYNWYRYIELAKGCLINKSYKEGLKVIGDFLSTINSNCPVYAEASFLKVLLSRKIVILILKSPGYEEYCNISREYFSNFGIEYWYYEYSDNYKEITFVDDKIYIPVEETFIPGILNKTIEVFKLFQDYDYIMRLNATSLVDLYKVQFGNELFAGKSIRKNFDYYGYLNSVKLNKNEKYGVTDEFINQYGSFPFVSGKCIILSKKAVKYFLESNINYSVMDDISIALSLKDKFEIDQINSFGTNNNGTNEVLQFYRTPEEMENGVKLILK